MNSIKPKLPPDLAAVIDPDAVAKSPPFQVGTYRALVGHAAHLAYRNPTHILFFRGQDEDYTVGDGTSSFYPAIYRGDYLPEQEVRYRFEVLEEAGRQLVEQIRSQKLDGLRDLTRRRYVRWAVLQHYGVCPTPLLDLTHSLRVACSFAQQEATGERAYVFVFGLPVLTHRITIDSEADCVTVRLLSICPPDALRPYFQDGYLVGTPDLEWDYEEKTELDLRQRLLAKFSLPSSTRFWGRGFGSIPESVLLPKQDRFRRLCEGIRVSIPYGLRSGEIGEFLAKWSELEEMVVAAAEGLRDWAPSFVASVGALRNAGRITAAQARALDQLRRIRNDVVHRPRHVDPDSATSARSQAVKALEDLRPRLGYSPGNGAS